MLICLMCTQNKRKKAGERSGEERERPRGDQGEEGHLGQDEASAFQVGSIELGTMFEG